MKVFGGLLTTPEMPRKLMGKCAIPGQSRSGNPREDASRG